jgi:hypothetical protein
MAVLNAFKTIVANVTTTSNVIYSAPTGYTTVVLLAQVANNSNANVYYVTGQHVRGGVPTTLVANVPVPVSDAVSLLTGKLILATYDSIQVVGSDNVSGQILLSILETANP